MLKKCLAVVFASFIATSIFAEDNGAFCTRMADDNKLEGRSVADCECVYNQADATLTPDMKNTMQQKHEAEASGEDMMRAMLELGEFNDVVARMENYGAAIDANCSVN